MLDKFRAAILQLAADEGIATHGTAADPGLARLPIELWPGQFADDLQGARPAPSPGGPAPR